MDKLLLAFITLGVVLVIAAVIGGGLKLFGYNIPVIHSWQRQVILAFVGVVLAGLSGAVYNLGQQQATQQAAQQAAMSDFNTKLTAIENGAAGNPPWPPERIEVSLGDVATLAGTDVNLNCRVADVIGTYHVSLPPVITVELQDSQNGSAAWLRCYRLAIGKAEAKAAQSMTGSPKAEIASSTQSTAILAAVTTANTQGWMYLGQLQAGSLDQARTILQDRVNVGGTVTTTKGVYLHEQGAPGDRSAGKIIGVVPAGSEVSIRNLSPPLGAVCVG